LYQEALARNWDKMGGKDNNNYTELIQNYVNKYATKKGLSYEEAEKALKNDSYYKTL
jgi:hypothetical protein